MSQEKIRWIRIENLDGKPGLLPVFAIRFVEPRTANATKIYLSGCYERESVDDIEVISSYVVANEPFEDFVRRLVEDE
jgi:hypothetical protein